MTVVQVPFTFEAWLKSAGGKSKPQVVIDSIEVDIPDLAGSDLSPAATVVLTHRFRADKLAFFRHRLMTDGTVLLGPSVAPIVDYKAGATTLERYLSRAGKGMDNISRAAWPDLRHLGALGHVMTRAELSGGILKHNRDLCARHASEIASSARFVDGVLHRPTSQPVYYRDGKGAVTPKLLDDLRGKVRSADIFPADDQDPLIEYVMSLPAKDQDDILERRTIHLHDPSIVTWDRKGAIETDIAREAVSKYARYLIELPREAVELWLDLREYLTTEDPRASATACRLIEHAAALGIRPSGIRLPEETPQAPDPAPVF